ncbi:hypothetical protein [Rhodopirellula baltica]|uniref:hypothetical protein n=1 Tax=Rhodopirellula baltica TaxID=265606 RepID=UPI0002F3E727
METIAKCISQFAITARRPCYTWQPSRCFGTKRGVIFKPSQEDVHRQATIAS